MLRTLIFAPVFCVAILLSQTTIERIAQADETVRIAASSGGVELDEIHINRRAALGAVKKADLTNMQLGLWFAADWELKSNRFPPLIHLQALSAVEDDTGRLLSTEGRLKEIEYLRGEVRGYAWKSNGRKGGP